MLYHFYSTVLYKLRSVKFFRALKVDKTGFCIQYFCYIFYYILLTTYGGFPSHLYSCHLLTHVTFQPCENECPNTCTNQSRTVIDYFSLPLFWGCFCLELLIHKVEGKGRLQPSLPFLIFIYQYCLRWWSRSRLPGPLFKEPP